MKTLMRITIVLLTISLNTYKSKSCIWVDNGDSYRVSMFKAEIEALRGYRAFYYTPYELNDYLPAEKNSDRYANCKEWQKALGNACTIDEIFEMLYGMDKTKLLNFVKDTKGFFETHKDNPFIKALEKNKEWGGYFFFSKLNEMYNMVLIDYWHDDSYDKKRNYEAEKEISGIIKKIGKDIFKKFKNQQIIERTAFHLLRLNRLEGNNEESIELYKKYFADKKSKSVVNNWAKLYYAEALRATGKEIEANLLLSQIFNSSEEKRIRAYRLFNFDLFKKTLELAKTKDEKATLWAMKAIHNPGPALASLKKVVSYNFKNKAIPLLIMREVNKLEDWIFTPEITGISPTLYTTQSSLVNDNDDQETINRKNKMADLAYLKELKLYLKKITPVLGPKLKDYLLVVRAHLAIIERQNNEALSLFKQVSHNAEKPILVQRSTELALYYVFEDKIETKKVQEKLVSTLKELEQVAKQDYFYYKYLYSITKLISNNYLRKNDVVTAGLFIGKSRLYSNQYESKGKHVDDYYSMTSSYYRKISFYDEYAGLKDMDNLMELIAKKNKNNLEKYLCKQDLASINALRDLKGTIALRQNNIQTAYNTFSKMPHNFWEKTYEFSTYLDTDPFVIRLKKPKKAQKYNFNKADVLKQLLEYKKEAEKNKKKACENYMKVANFFYNSAYHGTSWMMLSYGWGSYIPPIKHDLKPAQKHFENSFYRYEIALHYYNKAEGFATDPEDKANILLMKHLCKYYKYSYEGPKNKFDAKDVKDLYKNYKETELFKRVNCPTLKDFTT